MAVSTAGSPCPMSPLLLTLTWGRPRFHRPLTHTDAQRAPHCPPAAGQGGDDEHAVPGAPDIWGRTPSSPCSGPAGPLARRVTPGDAGEVSASVLPWKDPASPIVGPQLASSRTQT